MQNPSFKSLIFLLQSYKLEEVTTIVQADVHNFSSDYYGQTQQCNGHRNNGTTPNAPITYKYFLAKSKKGKIDISHVMHAADFLSPK